MPKGGGEQGVQPYTRPISEFSPTALVRRAEIAAMRRSETLADTTPAIPVTVPRVEQGALPGQVVQNGKTVYRKPGQ